jgi:hypothetical protein
MTTCERCGEVNPAEIHTCTPKREWHGLTEDDAISLLPVVDYEYEVDIEIILEFAKNIEAKLKQKNA